MMILNILVSVYVNFVQAMMVRFGLEQKIKDFSIMIHAMVS
jgi:hypothetical protein